jgi:hypothetical protein
MIAPPWSVSPTPEAASATALGSQSPVLLRGRWLWLGRAIWAGYALVAIALVLTNLPLDVSSPITFPGIGAPQSAILRDGLREIGIDPAVYAIYRTVLDQLAAVVSLAVAALLIHRKSSEGIVVLIAVFLTAGSYNNDPPSLIALDATQPIEATLGKVLMITRMTLLLALFFVFPDGRTVPRWGLVPVSLWFVQVTGIFFFSGTVLDSWDWPPLPTALGFALLFSPAIYAQIYRYRHLSGPVEQLQTKWAIGGLVVAITCFAALNVWLAAQELPTSPSTLPSPSPSPPFR